MEKQRNPQRIDLVLYQLKKVWKKNPDLRFSQVLSNFYSETTSEMLLKEDNEAFELRDIDYFVQKNDTED